MHAANGTILSMFISSFAGMELISLSSRIIANKLRFTAVARNRIRRDAQIYQ